MSFKIRGFLNRAVQVISLIFLGVVFWNYFKIRNRDAVPEEVHATRMTSFEKAVSCKCDQDFIETPEMTVVRILPENNEAVRHQKWVVQSASGHTLLFANNLELCQALPLKKGDRVFLAGQFKWTEKGGMIHWTHADPQQKRRDGFVRFEGKTYCQKP